LCQILGMPLANLFRLGQDYGSLNLLAPDKNFWRVVAMNIPAECPWIEFKG
jgi:probable phosphoglycerate mutase